MLRNRNKDRVAKIVTAMAPGKNSLKQTVEVEKSKVGHIMSKHVNDPPINKVMPVTFQKSSKNVPKIDAESNKKINVKRYVKMENSSSL